jgi:hypothetical protein
MSDSKQIAAAAASFDFLLSTISSDGAPWDSYLSLLRTGTVMTLMLQSIHHLIPVSSPKIEGTICVLGLPSTMSFNPISVVMRRLKIVGSLLASAAEINDMLSFCAKHNIIAKTEEMSMTPAGANAALARVEANLPRYRVVLVNKDNGKLHSDNTIDTSATKA